MVNDPQKPGYTSLSDDERREEWDRFFRECGSSCIVQRLLYNRDKKMVKQAAKKNELVVYYETKGQLGFKKK
jgi:hypothetical protein